MKAINVKTDSFQQVISARPGREVSVETRSTGQDAAGSVSSPSEITADSLQLELVPTWAGAGSLRTI